MANGSVLGPFKIMCLVDRGSLGELYIAEEKGRKLALTVFTTENIRAYQFAQWLHTQKAYALLAVGRVAEIHYIAMEYHVGAPWFPYDRLVARWERMPPMPTVYVRERSERDYLAYAPALLALIGLTVIATALHKRARPIATTAPAPVAKAVAAPPMVVSSTTPMAMWLKKGEQPELSWKPALREATLELATAADFREPLLRQTVSGTRLRVERALDDGRYYWRVNGSKSFELTLSRNEPPRILAPLPGQVIDIPQTLASVPLTFAWRCKPGQSVYRVQLSELPNFLNVLKDVVISGCQWPDVSMFPGAHYLRVRTEVPAGGTSEWSAPVPFRVQSN